MFQLTFIDEKCLTFGLLSPFTISEMMSMGTGKTMVLLFSWEMLFKVCR